MILKKIKINISLNKGYLSLSDSSYLILTACFFLSLGCQKEIKIDLPTYPPKLVVNCFFNPDSTWKVHLSSTIALTGKDKPGFIDNATVKLYENNILIATLAHTDTGCYTNNQKPLFNKLYTLKVTAPDYEDVECSDKLISTATAFTTKFDTTKKYITVKDLAFSENIPVSQLQVSIKDDPAVKNFYELRGIYKDPQAQPILARNVIFHSFSPGLETFSNYQQLVLFKDLLFSGAEIIVTLYLDNQITFGSTSLPNGNIGVAWWKVDNLYLDIKQVSEQYFLYQKTFLQQKYNQENPFSEPTKIYSNVKNGLGIFAGYQSYRVKLYK